MQDELEESVMRASAQENCLEYVNLCESVISSDQAGLMPESLARTLTVVPLNRCDDVLTVATSEPHDFEMVETPRLLLNREIKVALASRSAIKRAITQVYSKG
jgi:type II secretory ATPase GspE/PulE/Tfp pilus assembly ATPase PilB-like protein